MESILESIEELQGMIEKLTEDVALIKVSHILDNLLIELKEEKYDIPENKIIFLIRFLDTKSPSDLLLFHGILTNEIKILEEVFPSPRYELFIFLMRLSNKIQIVNEIFPKRSKKLVFMHNK